MRQTTPRASSFTPTKTKPTAIRVFGRPRERVQPCLPIQDTASTVAHMLISVFRGAVSTYSACRYKQTLRGIPCITPSRKRDQGTRSFASSRRQIHSSHIPYAHMPILPQGSAIYLEPVISLRHFALVCRSSQAIQNVPGCWYLLS